ncbi:MAG: Ig-like domain-containing protein [Rhodothermales bacterium]
MAFSLVAPANGSVGVNRDIEIEARIHHRWTGEGLDVGSVNSSNVRLYPAGQPASVVEVDMLVDEEESAIRLRPHRLLAANTPYVFEVTDDVVDQSERAAAFHRSTFRTGSLPTGALPNVAFSKERLSGTDGQHTTLTVGPDGKLYAAGINGMIRRWTIDGDGTVRDTEAIPTLWLHEGMMRLLIGLTFDPSSTADSLIAWVSHTTSGYEDMPDWGGKITRLSGPNLENAEDYVAQLPRSTRDHVTNSLVFGPDGALYVLQGGNTSIGDVDADWGNRPERMLSAAVLRVDVDALASGTERPLDAKTEDGGTYDPLDPTAPLRIYASGIRNAYDAVWHSNGYLYVPNNGGAKGGRTPEAVGGTLRPDGRPYVGPSVPSISNILVEDDVLYRVPPMSEDGQIRYRYYGHPNPIRGEYVLDGGNPTAGLDRGEVDLYPVGVEPDEDWEGFVYNFGTHTSPTGVIEYHGDAFNGALSGHLIIAFYGGRASGNLIVLRPDSDGGIVAWDDVLGIPGLTGFDNALDITEDVRTGFLYVSQMGDGGGIMLLRPIEAMGQE